MIRTKLTEMLGIEYPIVQGCMQWISRAPLVAAVSEAGGLGLLSSSTFSSADELQAEIRKIKSMTSKPFAVNLTLMPSLVVPDYAGYIRVCAEEGVKVMETAGRPPKDDMVRAIKDAGMVLIHKCTTVKHALKAQSAPARTWSSPTALSAPATRARTISAPWCSRRAVWRRLTFRSSAPAAFRPAARWQPRSCSAPKA